MSATVVLRVFIEGKRTLYLDVSIREWSICCFCDKWNYVMYFCKCKTREFLWARHM